MMNGVLRLFANSRTKTGNVAYTLQSLTKSRGNRLFSTFQVSPIKFSSVCVNSSVPLNRQYSALQNKEIIEQLQDFLDQEIAAEQEQVGSKTIPSKIDDFNVKLDGSLITLIKTAGNETVKIEFNVNDSVQLDEDTEFGGNLVSTPRFEVDITKGGTTLGFTLSFNGDPNAPENEPDDETADIFGIDCFTIHSGKCNENTYKASGDILDGTLYNLLMGYLETKGIHNDFAAKLSELSTLYEQSLYITLLRGLKKFTT